MSGNIHAFHAFDAHHGSINASPPLNVRGLLFEAGLAGRAPSPPSPQHANVGESMWALMTGTEMLRLEKGSFHGHYRDFPDQAQRRARRCSSSHCKSFVLRTPIRRVLAVSALAAELPLDPRPDLVSIAAERQRSAGSH